MIFIKSESNDVYFNLAMEEYVFNKFREEDVFILWVNSPSVVVGKHQNLLEEVNLKYCFENDINVARRISGGGTVFHDLGNLNYSYITNSTGNTGVDFKEFVKPIYDVLKNIDIDVEISPRNDLRIDEFKICGHAEYMRNKRVLHHGCILFDTNLENLSKSLKLNNLDIVSTSVKSVRSKVCNISDKLKIKYTFEEFLNKIENKIFEYFENVSNFYFQEADLVKIEKISNERYRMDEWIYGLSPKSCISTDLLRVDVDNGKIVNIYKNKLDFEEKNYLDKYFKYTNVKELKIY